MTRRCAFAPCCHRSPDPRCGTLVSSYRIVRLSYQGSQFPQGGSRVAERGRPRGFDEEEVLDVAMRLFWDHGFDGTSMSDLTEAMGINRRSIYGAFGNKEALFTAALEHYLAGPGAFVEKARALPTAREVAEAFLR